MDGVKSPVRRKSSYSGNNGGNCVEVAAWRKSTKSGNSGNCVEASAARTGRVLVRDTANREGAVLAVPAGAWQAFTDRLK
jgi:hypothetical protein